MMADTAIEILPDLVTESDFAGRQSLGARPNQEDAYGVVPPEELGGGRNLLAVVADGMGGHAAGEVASELAIQGFVDGFFAPESSDDASRLWAGLEMANRQIKQKIELDPSLVGMGTTLIALLIRDGTARWISIGDSPLFLVRDGEISRLNHMHLVGNDPLDDTTRTNSQEPNQNAGALAAAVIGERLFEVDDPDPIPLVSGDLLVAASDGINTLTEEELREAVSVTPEEMASGYAKALIETVGSRQVPRQDNTTVVVVRWT